MAILWISTRGISRHLRGMVQLATVLNRRLTIPIDNAFLSEDKLQEPPPEPPPEPPSDTDIASPHVASPSIGPSPVPPSFATSPSSSASPSSSTSPFSSTSPSSLATPVNSLGIQLIPDDLNKILFGETKSDKEARGGIYMEKMFKSGADAAKENLNALGLLNTPVKGAKQFPVIEGLSMPPLRGKNVVEHFENIAKEYAQPYFDYANELAEPIPTPPLKEIIEIFPGWTSYDHRHRKGERIKEILEDCMIMEVAKGEDGNSHEPFYAVAVTPKSWYVWCSEELFRRITVGDLLWTGKNGHELLGLTSNCSGKFSKKLIVSHGVGYTRARIQEEYSPLGTPYRYLDTRSLHQCLYGKTKKALTGLRDMCNSDLPQMIKDELQPVKFFANPLVDLQRVARQHHVLDILSREDGDEVAVLMDPCKKFRQMPESTEEMFKTQIIRSMHAAMLTHGVFRKLWPEFRDSFPLISFCGMLEVQGGYLPVVDDFVKWKQKVDERYEEEITNAQIALRNIVDKSKDVYFPVADGKRRQKPEAIEKDVWLSHLLQAEDRRAKALGLTERKRLMDGCPYSIDNISTDVPNWLKMSSRDQNMLSKGRLLLYHLRLKYNGQPLLFVDSPATYAYNEDEDNMGGAWGYKNDDGEWVNVHIHDKFSRNVNYDFAQELLELCQKGIVTSDQPGAGLILKAIGECGFWMTARRRLGNQLMWKDPATGVTGIIPWNVACGQISRRVTESMWMSASNPKPTKMGSEVKTKIRAPPGMLFVGSDVDSEEAWISSLLGDKGFAKIHGCTGLGWILLQGEKKEGTDIHSMTAHRLGAMIDRDTAKIINYSRFYGGGVSRTSSILLKRGVTEAVAMEKAAALHSFTLGQLCVPANIVRSVINLPRDHCTNTDEVISLASLRRVYGSREEYFKLKKAAKYYGGTESELLNQLKEITSQFPQIPVTPFLGCPLSKGIRLTKVGHTMYDLTRRNWVIQSSGVDFLHLLVLSMHQLCQSYNLEARLCFTNHDEVRYLAPSEQTHRVALALHISHLLVRSFFSYKAGIFNLPMSVAFFDSVDIDHCLRKDTTNNGITPTNDTPVKLGVQLDIYQTIRRTGGKLDRSEPNET